jgi:integrase
MSRKRGHRRAAGCVTEKRRLWYAVVNVDADANSGRGRQWSKGFKTRHEAERALAELLLEERTVKQTHSTVKYVVDQYIANDRTAHGQRSPTTTQGYRYLFGKLTPLYAKRVDALDGATVEHFYDDLRRSGLSDTTIHHVHNLLFAACKWAKKRKIGLVTRNPFDIYDIERPRRAPSTITSLTRKQARTAIEHLQATKHIYALTFSLATGCRRGEACGLKWESVDLERRVAVIKESRYQVKGVQGQKPTKSQKIREVPLNTSAWLALQGEKARQDARRETASDAWVETGHVFTDERGHPLSPMALTNAFSRIAKKAGLPARRLHDLRHTAATFMLGGGASLAATSQILGHSEKTTTLRIYGHVVDGDAVRATRMIDAALRERSQHKESESTKRRLKRQRQTQSTALHR